MVHKCLKEQGQAQDHPLAPLVSLWHGQKYKKRGRRDRSSTQARAIQQHRKEISSNSRGAAGCSLLQKGLSAHLGAADGQPGQKPLGRIMVKLVLEADKWVQPLSESSQSNEEMVNYSEKKLWLGAHTLHMWTSVWNSGKPSNVFQ